MVIDIYPSATSDFADITLPATDMFERADINLAGLGLQHKPFVQFTEALVEPGFERKPEWEIMARLEQAYLNEPENDIELPDPFARIDHMLGASDTSISALSDALIPVKVLESTAPEAALANASGDEHAVRDQGRRRRIPATRTYPSPCRPA